jgi:hypothetical protein
MEDNINTVILLNKNIEPFKSKWGAWCYPQQVENKYYVPLGWEEELDDRGIEYTIGEIEIINHVDEHDD